MKKIPDIINRLWNVCSQMEVGALLTCGSGITALIFFIISHPKDFSKASIWKEKGNRESRDKQTWTADHSLKNLQSIHLGYLRVHDCGRKKVDQTISDHTATDNLYWHCSARYTETRRFRLALLEWKDRQVSVERVHLPGIRLLFSSASKIPAWLFPSPYWPRLRLGQYVGSIIAGSFSASGNKVHLSSSYTTLVCPTPYIHRFHLCLYS